MADGAHLIGTTSDVRTLDRPRNPELLAFYQLWQAKRGARPLPARADFDPAEFRHLLANVMLLDILPAPDFYRVKLSGEAINQFYGRNIAGRTPREYMAAEAVSKVGELIQGILADRGPVCRTGQTYWQGEKSYKRFENCMLPLASDGETVDMLLVAIKFDI